MNYKNKILLFVVFVFEELLSCHCGPAPSLQYDVTKVLDRWFAKLFKIEPNAAKLGKSFKAAEHFTVPQVEYNLDHDIKPFQKKFLFVDVHFYMHTEDQLGTSRISQISCNFLKNKICIFLNKLRMTVKAKLRAKQNETGNRLFTTLNFQNFTLCASNDKNISYDISYKKYFVRNYGCERDIQWSGEEGGLLNLGIEEELTQETRSALVTMLRENIQRNKNFFQAFDGLFKEYMRTTHEMTANHPGILNQDQKYYYLIPQIPFHHFTLSSIVIRGLSNVDSLKVFTIPDIFTRSMAVKHLQGSLILDYGSQRRDSPKPMELSFKIDYLTISTRHKVNCAHVEAKYYEFSNARGPLTYRQSTFLMQSIESAIVSAVMPTKQEWRVCNLDSPLDEHKINDSKSEPKWGTIKEVYKDYVPFPDDEVVEIKIAE